MAETNRRIARREFLKQSARGTGFLALGVVTIAGSAPAATASDSAKSSNPFAYDLSGWEKTDPSMVRYREVSRFHVVAPEPRRIGIWPGERLGVATRGGVSVLDKEGSVVTDLSLACPARCVAADADGTVYAGLRDHIEVFDPKGQRIATWDIPSKRTWFTGLCLGSKDLFAADSANRCVLRYDLSGQLLGRIGEKNKERNIPGLIVPSPYLDVKIGPDGLLRVNNPGRHRVDVYTVEGDLEGSWGKASVAIDGFCGCCNPVGLACLAQGKWITCEKGLPRVKVYSSDGVFESVVAGPESFSQNGKPGSVRDLSDGTMGGLDVAADVQGRIYILDLVSRDIHVMEAKS